MTFLSYPGPQPSSSSEKPVQIYFLHANGIPGFSYKPLLDALSNDCSLWVYDRLGHNNRFPITRNWGYLVDEVVSEIQNTKPSSSPAILVGHSLGAVIAFLVAHKLPDRFAGVIMLDPPLIVGFAKYLAYGLKMLGLEKQLFPAEQTSWRRRVWADENAARTYFAGKSLYKNWHPEAFDAYLQHGLVPFEHPSAKPGEVTLRFEVDREVRIFETTPINLDRLPVDHRVRGVLVRGSESRVTLPMTASYLCRKHGFQKQLHPGGHMFPLESPLTTAEQVMSSIESLVNLNSNH